MRAFILALGIATIATASMAEPMRLEIDHAKSIRLKSAATGVVVGNAGIADVIVHDPKVLLFMGKSVGTTQVLVVGENGKTLFSTEIEVIQGDGNKLVTIQRGNEISTSMCKDRCVDILSPEDSTASITSTANKIKTRENFTSGK